jgi:hypothetical protein
MLCRRKVEGRSTWAFRTQGIHKVEVNHPISHASSYLPSQPARLTSPSMPPKMNKKVNITVDKVRLSSLCGELTRAQTETVRFPVETVLMVSPAALFRISRRLV